MSREISWDDQRTFLAVLEEGSLAGAARRLAISHATARAHIAALEQALGTTLFTRSVNGLTPTAAAQALHAPARRMALASAEFIRQASGRPGEASGVVRLSVPEFMGIEVMPAMLARLHTVHPGLQIELALSNAPADLLAQEVDVALRMVAPTQAALVARRVARIPLGLFASVAYLQLRGTPHTLAELRGHDFIGPDRNRSDLALAASLGEVLPPERLVLRTDSHPAQLAAARAGLGLAVVQIPVARRDPGLRQVLPEFVPARLDAWLVTHENLRHSPRVRAVMEGLAQAFAEPEWQMV